MNEKTHAEWSGNIVGCEHYWNLPESLIEHACLMWTVCDPPQNMSKYELPFSHSLLSLYQITEGRTLNRECEYLASSLNPCNLQKD